MISKKRLRKIISCLNCRRKKRKCDRNLPCSQCLKVSIGDTCSYDPGINNSTTLENTPESSHAETISAEVEERLNGNDSELEKSKVLEQIAEKLKNIASGTPHTNTNLKFNLLRALNADKNDKYRVFHMKGFFGMATLPQADPSITFMQMYMRHALPSWYAVYTKDSVIPESAIPTYDQRTIGKYGNMYIPAIKNEYNREEIEQLRVTVSRFGARWGIEYHPDPQWPLLTFRAQVLALFPPYHIVKLYMDCFFERNCLGYPILEESSFRESVEKLFATDAKVAGDSPRILSKSDIPIIVSLLLVMRVSYLTLRYDKDDLTTTFYSQHPVSIDVVHITEKLLKQFNIHTEATIELLQALTVSYCYHFIGSESDCFLETGEPQTILTEIFSVAKVLRIDEDPKIILTWPERNEQNSNIREWSKRFWCILLLLDLEMCTLFGRPSSLRHSELNIHAPQMPTENTSNGDGFRTFLDSLKHLIQKLHLLVDKLFTPGSLVDSLDLILKLTEFESQVNACPFKTIIEQTSQNSAVYQLRFYLMCKCFYLTVYYALYLYYEKKDDSIESFRYLKKLVVVAHYDLSFVQSGLVQSWSSFLGSNSFLPFRSVFAATNKAQLIVLGRINMRIRCNSNKNSASLNLTSIRLSEAFKTLENHLAMFQTNSLEFAHHLSKGSYCCHWLLKSYRFGLRIMRDLMKLTAKDKPDEICFKFSGEQFDELKAIYRKASEEYELMNTFFQEIINSQQRKLPVEEEEDVCEILQLSNMWRLVLAIRDFVLGTDNPLWEGDDSDFHIDRLTHQFLYDESYFNGFITEESLTSNIEGFDFNYS